LIITLFLHWFGSFFETEITFKQHGQISKPLGNCSQQNKISHSFHQIANV